jgi:sigma-B regulation protein RsbU (phosphoserine phosphatase)
MKSTKASNPMQKDSSAGKMGGRLSLRTKLALLIIASLCFALIPVLLLAQRYVEEQALNAEKQNFFNTLSIASENLSSNFNNMLASKVSSVLQHKRNLKEAALAFDQLALLRKHLAGQQGYILEHMQQDYEAIKTLNGIRIFEITPADMDRFGNISAADDLPLWAGLVDSKGVKLAQLLQDLPPSGSYSVFSMYNVKKSAQPETSLLFFLPHFRAGTRQGAGNQSPQSITVAVISLHSLEQEEKVREKQLIENTQERFGDLTLYPGGFIALLDAQGKTLAAQGDIAQGKALTPLFNKARMEGWIETELSLPQADWSSLDMLVRADYVKPFGWFIVIAAPMKEIRAPAGNLLRRVTLLSLLAGALALLISLGLLSSTVRPLRLLTKKIRALPDMDFSSEAGFTDLASDLPKNQRDEVGDLTRSFSALVKNLRHNILELMEASRAKEHMQGELAAARDIQLGILPAKELASTNPSFSSSAFLDPAKEVGGDLYDFFQTPDGRHAFVIGDVSGKGVPAALFMAITVTLVRSTLGSGLNPAAALDKINNLLQAHNPSHMFVTLFLGLYTPENGHFEYANAGHNPPYTIQRGNKSACGSLEGLSGPMAGIFPGINYELFCRDIQKDELCLLYTDGVTEAADTELKLYEEARLKQYLENNRDEAPLDLIAGIYEDIKKFRGSAEPSDDITMLAFARNTQ